MVPLRVFVLCCLLAIRGGWAEEGRNIRRPEAEVGTGTGQHSQRTGSGSADSGSDGVAPKQHISGFGGEPGLNNQQSGFGSGPLTQNFGGGIREPLTGNNAFSQSFGNQGGTGFIGGDINSRPQGGLINTGSNTNTGFSGGSTISRPQGGLINSGGSSNTGSLGGNNNFRPQGGQTGTGGNTNSGFSGGSTISRPQGGLTNTGGSSNTGSLGGNNNFRPQGGQTGTGGNTNSGFSGGSTTSRPQGGLTNTGGSSNTGSLGGNNNSGTLGSNTNTGSGQQIGDKGEVCYPILGCFSLKTPWKTDLRPVPEPSPPEKNKAVIYYYSRPNIEERHVINLYPEFKLGNANFNSRRPTVFIIHGFIQGGNEKWMDEMKDAYLRHVDANVMIVDWQTGSLNLSYLKATSNTRVIGRMLAKFINSLIEYHGAHPRDIHLIGHSLGAQISSYVGKEVRGIGRLTALDPAQPAFEGFDPAVRLDKSDAEFVDVIHTDAKPFIPLLGFGMIRPHGHVDFYMNGGFDQPLCVAPATNDLKDVKSLKDLATLPYDYISRTYTCDHSRAHAYMFEALNNTDCVFMGHKANAKNIAQTVLHEATQGIFGKYTALSKKCSKDDCIPLGFDTKKSPLRGTFVVTTNGKAPYCIKESN